MIHKEKLQEYKDYNWEYYVQQLHNDKGKEDDEQKGRRHKDSEALIGIRSDKGGRGSPQN